jgi:putative ABC transport system ATP-binding protein
MEQIGLTRRNEEAACAVELRHVRKVYGSNFQTRREVFADVSLRAAPGEFIAISGPIGCGKTTLVNMIAGLDRPNNGLIRVWGAETTRLTDDQFAGLRATTIGLVPQVQSLLDDLTVSENVEVPLYFLTDNKQKPQMLSRRTRVEETLKRMGLVSDAKRKVSALSVGEKQIVSIARALVTDPPLLLMDEPTESLDAVMSDMVLELLRGDNMTRGRTIIVTTHDKNLSNMANRTIRLKKRLAV